MAYEIIDVELEVIFQDWPVDWCEPVSAEEISIGPPVDATNEKFQAQKDPHEFDGESSMESDPKTRHTLEELRTKICMEFDISSNSHLVMDNQLQWLIKDITDATDVAP